MPLSGYDGSMWETFLVLALVFLGLSVFLRLLIRKTVRKRHEAIAPGKFDFDAFKSRELTRRGVHDATRLRHKH